MDGVHTLTEEVTDGQGLLRTSSSVKELCDWKERLIMMSCQSLPKVVAFSLKLVKDCLMYCTMLLLWSYSVFYCAEHKRIHTNILVSVSFDFIDGMFLCVCHMMITCWSCAHM